MAFDVLSPPDHCEYAAGPCDQSFKGIAKTDAFVAFPSDPASLAATIQGAVDQLNRSKPNHKWVSWKDLQIAGQIIFCEICRAIRGAQTVVAEVSTLNFNVLFELGYAFGLNKPLLLFRDPSYSRDSQKLDELGFLDTLGYEPYSNSDDIRKALLEKEVRSLDLRVPQPSRTEKPLYVVFPPVRVDGILRLQGALKKSAFDYRQFDPAETPRLTLSEIERQVSASQGVVLPLLDPARAPALVHNARSAFVAGVALAKQRHVLLLQEGQVRQPIDYRDLILAYDSPAQVQAAVERLVRRVGASIQKTIAATVGKRREGRLARLDLGDIAAENEEDVLNDYFVYTAQFIETRNGHARLVVGRKGTGKSAIFSQLKHEYAQRAQQYLLVDLKPEGYQLRKLVDLMRGVLDAGTREQLLVTMWDYVLLCEIAHKIIEADSSWAYRDPETLRLYKAVEEQYTPQQFEELGDFSERLLALLGRLESRLPAAGVPSRLSNAEVTNAIWQGDIRPLRNAVAEYLEHKKEVWLLFDNLDKSWPVSGATEHDLLVLRTLLEAGRKLQHQLSRRKIVFKNVVFIRTDIYEELVANTPDRGKESRVSLDNPDIELMKEMLRRRAEASLAESLDFEQFMSAFFDRHVGGEDTMRFLFRHTLGRARDVLRLAKKCIEFALNRGRDRVLEDDVRAAVAVHSNELLRELLYEIKDTHPDRAAVLDEFIGASESFNEQQLKDIIARAGIAPASADATTSMLLWYQFLGLIGPTGDELYSQQFEYNVDRMIKFARTRDGGDLRFVIHPAFRDALKIAPAS